MTTDAPETILHVLNKTPDHPRSRACIEQIESGDGLILIENGVMAVTLTGWLNALPRGTAVHVMQDDLASRGIVLPSGAVSGCDYHDFVRLICQFPRTIYW